MAFRQGRSYKITCAGDGTVLDLVDSSTANNAQIITTSFIGGDNQTWTVTRAVSGWRLSSLVQENPDPEDEIQNKCLETNLKCGTIRHCLRKAGLNLNQQWFVQKLNSSKLGLLRVMNVASNKCLTSHGVGEEVTCEVEDIKNTNQHWLITPVETLTTWKVEQVVPVPMTRSWRSTPKLSSKIDIAAPTSVSSKAFTPTRTIWTSKIQNGDQNSHQVLKMDADADRKNYSNSSPMTTISHELRLRCITCSQGTVDSVFYSCGHMIMCFECAAEFYRSKTEEERLCPICRAEIKDFIRTQTVAG